MSLLIPVSLLCLSMAKTEAGVETRTAGLEMLFHEPSTNGNGSNCCREVVAAKKMSKVRAHETEHGKSASCKVDAKCKSFCEGEFAGDYHSCPDHSRACGPFQHACTVACYHKTDEELHNCIAGCPCKSDPCKVDAKCKSFCEGEWAGDYHSCPDHSRTCGPFQHACTVACYREIDEKIHDCIAGCPCN